MLLRDFKYALLSGFFILPLACGQPESGDTNGYALGAGASESSEDGDATNDAHCARARDRARQSKPHKVSICHIPPGNPANAHTINISKKAVDAHLAHGDDLGGCGCGDDGNGGGPVPGGGQPNDGDEPHDDSPTPNTDDDPTPSPDSPDDGTDDGSSEPPSTDDLCDTDQTICAMNSDCTDFQACDYGCCVDVIL